MSDRSNYCDDCQDPDEEVCFSCWQANEREIIDTPTTRQAAKLIQDLRSFCVAGGNLHIHIEDMNLDDHFFDVGQLLEYQRDETPDEYFETEADMTARHQVERELFYLLRSMSLEERYSACELADECEAPVQTRRERYHNALTEQLRAHVAASSIPDLGEAIPKGTRLTDIFPDGLTYRVDPLCPDGQAYLVPPDGFTLEAPDLASAALDEMSKRAAAGEYEDVEGWRLVMKGPQYEGVKPVDFGEPKKFLG